MQSGRTGQCKSASGQAAGARRRAAGRHERLHELLCGRALAGARPHRHAERGRRAPQLPDRCPVLPRGRLRGLERRHRRLERSCFLAGRPGRRGSRRGTYPERLADRDQRRYDGRQPGDAGPAHRHPQADHLRRAYRQPHTFSCGPRKRSGGRDQRFERRAPRCVERQSRIP